MKQRTATFEECLQMKKWKAIESSNTTT
jgi:hypothetical protein